MLTFKEIAEATDTQMRSWVGKRLEDTDMAHDEMKKQFIKQFGQQYAKKFDQIVSDMVD